MLNLGYFMQNHGNFHSQIDIFMLEHFSGTGLPKLKTER